MTTRNHLKWNHNTHFYTTVTCCVIKNKLMSLCTLRKLGNFFFKKYINMKEYIKYANNLRYAEHSIITHERS